MNLKRLCSSINWPRLKKFSSINYARATWLIVCIVFGVSVYLLVNLVKELRTPNYGYSGTHYDFIAFYSVASTVLHHHSALLYNAKHLTYLQRQIIPHPIGATGYMPFLNPPFVAVLLAPLALMNIDAARLFWLFLNVIFVFFILYQLTRPLKYKQKLASYGLLILTFPMYQAFVEGQLSILVLLGGSLSYLFLTQGRKYLSGASLVLLWVIPQFGIFALIGLAVKREWLILKGWLISSVLVLLATLPVTGLDIYFKYIRVLTSAAQDHFVNMSTSSLLTWRGALELTMGINGFLTALIGQKHTLVVNILYFIVVVVLLAILVKAIQRIKFKLDGQNAALLYSAWLLSSLLIDPNLFAQDIIVIYLLLPAIYYLYQPNSFKAIVMLAASCDLVLVDQYSKLHFFALVIFIAAVIAANKLSLNNSHQAAHVK